MNIFFLTGNKGKLEEAMAIIPEIQGKEIDLEEIQELDVKKIIENKLELAAKQLTGNLIVDDTSLYITALNGLPGPLIKWFMKTVGNEGLIKMAKAFGDNQAEARTWIGYYSNGKTEFFEGVMKGRIVDSRGENGFGWDSIFEIEGKNKTLAELTSEEKNKISTRKIALEKLKEYLKNKLTFKLS